MELPELLQTNDQQHYGAIINPTPDPRNHDLASYVPIAETASSPSYYPDLSGISHFHQHKLGACVGHASAKSKQVSVFHETGNIPNLSPRFIYAVCKAQDGAPEEGTYPELAAKVLQKVGCATEDTVLNDTFLDHETYVYHRNLKNIPDEAFLEATKHKISNYSFAKINESALKTAIKFAGENKGGVFMLMKIDKAWWTDRKGNSTWDKDAILPLRPPSDPATLGGHEVYPYAFDVKNGRTIIYIFNSWGDTWGDGGNGWFYLDEWLPHIVQIISCVDLPSDYVADKWTYTFTQALQKGMSGSDVVALQHALKISGEYTFPKFTGYFGDITLQAVRAFQIRYASEILAPAGLTQPTGYVGTNTIKKLNALYSIGK